MAVGFYGSTGTEAQNRPRAGGVVPGVAERGAMLPGCFGSMFPRTAGESLRLARFAVGHPHPASP